MKTENLITTFKKNYNNHIIIIYIKYYVNRHTDYTKPRNYQRSLVHSYYIINYNTSLHRVFFKNILLFVLTLYFYDL